MSAHGRNLRRLGSLPLAGLLLLTACGGDETAPPVPSPVLTVNQAVANAGWFPTIDPDSTAFAVVRFDSTGGGGEELSCRTFSGDQTVDAERLMILDPQATFAFPGAILQYATLASAVPTPVVADRAGANLVLAAPAGGEVAGSVPVIGEAEVDEWRRAALGDLGAVAPGPWSVAVGAAYSQQHAALLGGVAPAALSAEAAERLAFDDQAQGRAIVRLERVHHLVGATWPGTPSAAFAPDVTGADLAGQMELGNPPVWVDAVAHGQLLLVLVESSAPAGEVVAAAERTFRAAVSGEDPAAGPLIGDLPDLDVKVFASGADADAAETAALAGQQSLTAFLQAAPGNAADLPPVSASLAALRNGGPVSFGFAATFAFVACEVYEPVFETVLWGYEARDARTVRRADDLHSDGLADFPARAWYNYEGGTQNFTSTLVTSVPDLKGGGGPATPTAGRREPFLVDDALNGFPVFEFYQLALPGGVLHCDLRFDGSALVRTDYTIFLVMGLPGNIRLRVAGADPENFSHRNTPDYFLHGDEAQVAQSNLLIGRQPDTDFFVFQHDPYGPEVADFTLEDQMGWHVYAFAFGVEGGMAIYVDGDRIGGDDFLFYPLIDFDHATVGARWFGHTSYDTAALWLAEIVAYRGYGEPAAIAAETARLEAKYGL